MTQIETQNQIHDGRGITETSRAYKLLEQGRQRLHEQGIESVETVTRRDLGIATASLQWGIKLDDAGQAAAAIDHIQKVTGQEVPTSQIEAIQAMVLSSGADYGYWTKDVKTREQYYALQIALGNAVSGIALKNAGIEPYQIQTVMIAAGAPGDVHLARDIAETLGITWKTHPDPDSVVLVNAACASSALAFKRACERYQKDPSQRYLLLTGIETMSALRNRFDALWPGTIDIGALTLFGDNASATVFDLSRLKTLFSYEDELPDETIGAIRTLPTLPTEYYSTDPTKVLLERPGLITARMPLPLNGGLIEVSPRGCAQVFKDFPRHLIQEGVASYINERGTDFRDLNRFIMHRPSKKMFEHRAADVKEIGKYNKDIPWVKNGNTVIRNPPPNTFAMEWASLLPELKPGDKIGLLFYGAGVTGVCMGLQLV